MGERAGMRNCSFGRETRCQAQQEDPWALPRCHRQEKNGNHVCKAASCSEAVGRQDRVCRGKQQRVERMKEGIGQVLARDKPAWSATWSTVPITETGVWFLKMAEPVYSSLPSLMNFGNPAEIEAQIPLMH